MSATDHEGRVWDARAELDIAELIDDYLDLHHPPESSLLAAHVRGLADRWAADGVRRLALAESDSERLAAEELEAEPLREVWMPELAYRALKRAGVQTDRQLAAMTHEELLAVRGVGPAFAEQVRRGLLWHCLHRLGCEGPLTPPDEYFEAFLGGLHEGESEE
jgi:hypothetical protein